MQNHIGVVWVGSDLLGGLVTIPLLWGPLGKIVQSPIQPGLKHFQYKKDKELLRRVQHRATEMFRSLQRFVWKETQGAARLRQDEEQWP